MSDADTIPAEARSFAVTAHGNQLYGETPYKFSSCELASILTLYGEEARVVGYLHDVVEDTKVMEADVRARFGAHISECVALLTDAPGVNRKERKAKTYGRLATVTGPTQFALLVKVADRLANVTACIADNKHSLWEIYRSEHQAFKQAAHREGLCEPLWAELDALIAHWTATNV